MEFLDYCEHCGSTTDPVLRVKADVVLEGNIGGNELEDMEIKPPQKNFWVCSECGVEVEVKDG